jgi:hypothetical protein
MALMIQRTAAGNSFPTRAFRSQLGGHGRVFRVRHIASVKVLSHPFVDYLHVAKIGDRWLIVNVLWELRKGEKQPPSLQ